VEPVLSSLNARSRSRVSARYALMIVSTFMCEIVFCQSLEERQVRRHFSYGF